MIQRLAALAVLIGATLACGPAQQTAEVITVEVPVLVEVTAASPSTTVPELPDTAQGGGGLTPGEPDAGNLPATDEPTSLPTAMPRTRIVLHGIESSLADVSRFVPGHYSKLAALAFTQGYRLDIYRDVEDFIAELSAPDVVAAMYQSWASPEALVALDAFRKSGGRVLMVYDGAWIRAQNEPLQLLYGVTVAYEPMIAREQTIIYDSGLLPPALRGYQVGMASDAVEFRVSGYLVTLNPAQEVGTITSQETGQERTVYLNLGNVIFLPSVFSYEHDPEQPAAWQQRFWYGQFYADEQIDYFDNEAAARALLSLLTSP